MGSIPGLAQWVKDLALLWLWHRLAATALIRLLAWEPPYAADAALEKTKNKQTNKQNLNPIKPISRKQRTEEDECADSKIQIGRFFKSNDLGSSTNKL